MPIPQLDAQDILEQVGGVKVPAAAVGGAGGVVNRIGSWFRWKKRGGDRTPLVELA